MEQTRLLARVSFILPIAIFAFNQLALKSTTKVFGPAMTLVVLGFQIALYCAAVACGVVALRRVRRVGAKGVKGLSWTGIALAGIALVALFVTFAWSALPRGDRVLQSTDLLLEVKVAAHWERLADDELELVIHSRKLDAVCHFDHEPVVDFSAKNLRGIAHRLHRQLARTSGPLYYDNPRGSPTTVAGFEAREYEIRFSEGGSVFKGIHTVTKTRWKVHRVLCFTPVSRFEAQRPEIEAVISSIRFNLP